MLCAALLVACSVGSVDVDPPSVSGAEADDCVLLLDRLPDTLFGQERREVSPSDALAAAWGDPAVVLRCGVAQPTGYEPGAECVEVRGVGWFVPDAQLQDTGEDAVATAMTHRPLVELTVPSERREEGVDQALAELAPVIEESLSPGKDCL